MGFLTGFVTGAAGQVNADYADAQKTRDTQFARQQAMVDKVAADNDGMRKQAQSIAERQNSYMGQYSIPSDMAYTLATDPAVDKMDPDKRADYIGRLKPTGNYIPPQQAAPDKTIPGFQQQRGVLGGGNINVPPQTVPNSGSPQMPARQTYAPGPPQPDYRRDYGPFPVPTQPGQAEAQQRVAAGNVHNGQPPDPNDVTLAYSKDPKEIRNTSIQSTADRLSKGELADPVAAENYYQQISGLKKPSGFDWSQIQATGKNNPTDDAKQKEIDRIMSQHPERTRQEVTDAVYGMTGVTETPSGETKVTNKLTGEGKTIQNPFTAPPQSRNEAMTWLRQAPNMIRQSEAVTQLFDAAPNAAGISGVAIDKVGGEAINGLRAIGATTIADTVNKSFGVDKVQNARNALTAFNAALAKPLTEDSRVPVYVRQQLSQITADDTHHTLEQIKDSNAMIRTYYLANALDNMNVAGYTVPKGLNSTDPAVLMPAIAQFKADVTSGGGKGFGMNLGPASMKSLVKMAINVAHGNDPYDLTQVFGDIRKQNGPNQQ